MLYSTLLSLGLLGLAQTALTAADSRVFKAQFTTTLNTGIAGLGSTKTLGVDAVTSVSAGEHQTWDNVLIDTGSALLWVGRGSQKYDVGPHTLNGSHFAVSYGAGYASGIAYRDLVTVGNVSAYTQYIGAANYTDGFTQYGDIDGILGLGPPASNQGDISGWNTTYTFVQSLWVDGATTNTVFGLYIAPLGEDGEPKGSGEITFGGVDQSRIQGNVTWIPQLPNDTFHWGLNVASVSFGEGVVSNGTLPGYTDSGNIWIGIPTDQYIAILHTVPGAALYSNESSALFGGLIFRNTTASALPDLVFSFDGLNVTIPPPRYIVQESLYSSLNVTNDGTIYTWITSAGEGEVLLGEKFLENVYSAYDLNNHLIGFANLA